LGVGSRDFFFNWGLDGFQDTISTVHNGFLEVLLGVGILGFIPWFLAAFYALSVWRREFLSLDGKSPAAVIFFPVLLVCTFMSVGFGGAQGEMFMLFSLICYLGYCE
jgi:O-antigen ligase